MSTSHALHRHQASLVERLVADERVRIALVAPTGMGKTRAMMVAIDRLVRRDPSSTKVLIVAPAAIGNYIAGQLRELEGATRVQHLKGADLRLQEEGMAPLSSGVYAVSTELVRQSWARKVLVSLPWSLAFVDEAHYGGPATAELIAQLSRSETTQRLCAASATGSVHWASDLDLVSWEVQFAQRTARRVVSIQYERSPEEFRVRERLAALEDEFGADGHIRAALDAAWRSSASAFEYVLARQASVVGATVAISNESADPIVRERIRPTEEKTPRRTWTDPAGAAFALEQLLRDVGKLGQDSKLDAFLSYYAAQAPRPLVVFTTMRQTAVYLQSALASQNAAAAVIDGARASDDRVAPNGASVVIVTDAVLPAIETLNAHEGVSYDLPRNPQRIEARWSSLQPSGGEVVLAILNDVSNADRVESELARKHSLISEFLDLP
jgi:superfamily II DNA or RNA helicase